MHFAGPENKKSPAHRGDRGEGKNGNGDGRARPGKPGARTRRMTRGSAYASGMPSSCAQASSEAFCSRA